MDATLLDTDILSEILKRRDAQVTAQAAAYLREHGQFTISAFSRFEVRRGYVERRATRQLARFDVFCGHSLVLPATDAVFDRACIHRHRDDRFRHGRRQGLSTDRKHHGA